MYRKRRKLIEVGINLEMISGSLKLLTDKIPSRIFSPSSDFTQRERHQNIETVKRQLIYSTITGYET
jgi:hypothetical protein